MVARSITRLGLVGALAIGLTGGVVSSTSAQIQLDRDGYVTVNATLNSTITLVLSSNTSSFGNVSPGGNGVAGLNDADSGSSYFLAAGPVMTVLSNAPWSATLTGSDPATPATSLTLANGALSYQQYPTTANLNSVTPTLSGVTMGGLPSGVTVSVPATYGAADGMTGIAPGSQSLPVSGAPGLTSTIQLYALHVQPGDTAGASGESLNADDNVSFTLTYSVSQGPA